MSDVTVPDAQVRCGWVSAAPEFLAYHDSEWGFPVGDDRQLFEKLCLESFQSGLSWRTILAKRENFRRAFTGFDVDVVANFGQVEIERLLTDVGIVRHRGKIEAVINNARRVIELTGEGGSLAAYFWGFEPEPDEVESTRSVSVSPSSIRLSKDLKRRGFKFVGPTTAHAFMQAVGLVNDHATECVTRTVVSAQRARFLRPR